MLPAWWDRFIVLSRFDCGAKQNPGVVEETLANDSLRRWVHNQTDSGTNSFAPTAENLKPLRVRGALRCLPRSDGSGSDRFEAHFYPPVPKLTGDAQKLGR